MKINPIQSAAILLMVITVVLFLLMAFRKIDYLFFWAGMIILAILAFGVIPRFDKRKESRVRK